jgi:hypothetical protein
VCVIKGFHPFCCACFSTNFQSAFIFFHIATPLSFHQAVCNTMAYLFDWGVFVRSWPHTSSCMQFLHQCGKVVLSLGKYEFFSKSSVVSRFSYSARPITNLLETPAGRQPDARASCARVHNCIPITWSS